MREILFRGKTTDRGEWVQGCYTETLRYNNLHWIWDGKNHFTVNPDTIGQYTGLTDKNGKKIFEGDIIRYADIDEYKMYLESLECPEEYEGINFSDLFTIDSVVYGIEIGYPAFDLSNHEWECNGLSNLNESCQYFYEVIGNIHDNPELLEGSVGNESKT